MSSLRGGVPPSSRCRRAPLSDFFSSALIGLDSLTEDNYMAARPFKRAYEGEMPVLVHFQIKHF